MDTGEIAQQTGIERRTKGVGCRTDIPNPTEARESKKEKQSLGAGCQYGKVGGGWSWGLLRADTEEAKGAAAISQIHPKFTLSKLSFGIGESRLP